MKARIIVLYIMLLSLTAYAEEKKSIYSGGMLIFQPGISIGSNDYQPLQNYSTAVGGILRMYFLEYGTVGLYGGHQKSQYNTSGSENSHFNLGYGGGFVGFSHQKGKFRYTASAFAGMGTMDNLHIENQVDTELDEAHLYKEAMFLYSPILSIDYALTKRIYLTLQTVCLMGKYQNQPYYNPTLQVGILFLVVQPLFWQWVMVEKLLKRCMNNLVQD